MAIKQKSTNPTYMKILPATEIFQLTKSRRKQFDALEALQRFIKKDTLAAQAQDVRQTVMIGGVPTYWSPPFVAEAPPYITTMSEGIKRLFLVDPKTLNVALYEGGGDLWQRRVLTQQPEMILAALPRRALSMPAGDEVASARQLATLRKVLDLPVDHELPILHSAAVSLVIDRVVLTKALMPIAADFEAWIKPRPDEVAA